jgi:hypothetical protein
MVQPLRRIAWLVVSVIALGTSLMSASAVLADFGPQITLDKVVTERGSTVTVTLTGFAPNQQVAVVVTMASDTYQGGPVTNLPVTTDGTGTGFAAIATGGLATGDYVVNTVGPGGVVLAVPTAFGVIDPGTLGPRVVRVAPIQPDER